MRPAFERAFLLSAYFDVDVALSGCAPDRAVTFFCFAKRKSPKVTEWDFAHFAKRSYAKAKRRAEVRAAARFLALLAAGGGGLNSLRSNNARPDPPAAALLSPATRHRGVQTTGNQQPLKDAPWRVLVVLGAGYSVLIAVMRRRVAQGAAEEEAQMFERSEFLRLPPFPSNAACPERSGGTTNPARLSLLTFFGEAKKVSALSGARPDKATHAPRHH